jgi:hypothetical protein
MCILAHGKHRLMELCCDNETGTRRDLYAVDLPDTLHSVPTSMPQGQAMLVVGHPGHELRVHGWLESAKPIVMVLTDGSGHRGISRLASTTALLTRAGASAGSVYGRLTDAALYRALLDRDTALFVGLVEELADAIINHRITIVAGDEAEGYNPTHDVCRLIIDAAVAIARSPLRDPIANLSFLLMDRPGKFARTGATPTAQIVLDDSTLERKIAAARRYPEMSGEVEHALTMWGAEAFRVEAFRRVPDGELWGPAEAPPFYEQYGQEQVRAGKYAEVIRYDQHIRPLADALGARALRQAS